MTQDDKQKSNDDSIPPIMQAAGPGMRELVAKALKQAQQGGPSKDDKRVQTK